MQGCGRFGTQSPSVSGLSFPIYKMAAWDQMISGVPSISNVFVQLVLDQKVPYYCPFYLNSFS